MITGGHDHLLRHNANLFRSANSAAYNAIEETLKGECIICGIGVPLMKMRHAEDGAGAGGDREAIRSP